MGACLWLVWMEVRRLTAREQRLRRETGEQIRQQFTTLKENLSRELARERREPEGSGQELGAAVQEKLEELQELVDSLRILEGELTSRAESPAPGSAAPASEAPVRKEARLGFGIISRERKP